MNKQKLNILLVFFIILPNCKKPNEKLLVQPPEPVYFSKSWKANLDNKKGHSFIIYCNQKLQVLC